MDNYYYPAKQRVERLLCPYVCEFVDGVSPNCQDARATILVMHKSQMQNNNLDVCQTQKDHMKSCEKHGFVLQVFKYFGSGGDILGCPFFHDSSVQIIEHNHTSISIFHSYLCVKVLNKYDNWTSRYVCINWGKASWWIQVEYAGVYTRWSIKTSF